MAMLKRTMQNFAHLTKIPETLDREATSPCVSFLSRSAEFPPSLVVVKAGQRPAHCERKRASLSFQGIDDRGGWPFFLFGRAAAYSQQ